MSGRAKSWMAFGLLAVSAAVVAMRPWETRPRVLLDATTRLGVDGAWLGFTLDAPGTVEIRAELPPGVSTEVVWGPLGPALPGQDPLAPDSTRAERARIRGDEGPVIRKEAASPGLYVVRIAPVPVAMGETLPTVRVRVTVR